MTVAHVRRVKREKLEEYQLWIQWARFDAIFREQYTSMVAWHYRAKSKLFLREKQSSLKI